MGKKKRIYVYFNRCTEINITDLLKKKKKRQSNEITDAEATASFVGQLALARLANQELANESLS